MTSRRFKNLLLVFLSMLAIVLSDGCQNNQMFCVQGSSEDTYGNLDMGIPSVEDCRLDRTGYSLGFRFRDMQPAWVSYVIVWRRFQVCRLKRHGDFTFDEDVRMDGREGRGSAFPWEYWNSGYDRGHLAPAADMAWSEKTMAESFLMSNMSPQRPGCNRQTWRILEEWVRKAAQTNEVLYVVTGPVLDDPVGHIGDGGRITVPRAFFKVLGTRDFDMVAFIVPNHESDKKTRDFVVTVDEVERLTGLDFFSEVPEEVQDEKEAVVDLRGFPAFD